MLALILLVLAVIFLVFAIKAAFTIWRVVSFIFMLLIMGAFLLILLI